MKYTLTIVILSLCAVPALAQVPVNVGTQILKAEDARDYNTLKTFLISKDPDIRARAVLAAGRIGDESSVDDLAGIMENGDPGVRPIAAFALGETEADKAATSILRVLDDLKAPADLRARAVEAAGKIAAANPKSQNAKKLGDAIVSTLRFENSKRSAPSTNVIRLALTAALRAKPEGADETIKPFLGYSDPNVIADALNALTRLRAKNCNDDARRLLSSNEDAVIRANAARLLGSSEDKDAIDLLIKIAISDEDLRVRVSSIRSLGSLKDLKAVERLLDRGDVLLEAMAASKYDNPVEKNELLEIITTLGRLLPDTEDNKAVILINKFRMADGFSSPESEIALARIAPIAYSKMRFPDGFAYHDPDIMSAYSQGMATLAATKDDELRADAGLNFTEYIAGMSMYVKPSQRARFLRAIPDMINAMAALKPDNIDEILRGHLSNADVFVRTTAANLLGERPSTKKNLDALKAAFSRALIIDKVYDDAPLAILDAIFKLDKKESVGSLLLALNAPDYLVRKKAFELLDDEDLKKQFPGIESSVESAEKKKKDMVLPYAPAFGTKLGQVLNTNIDYRRALSRKNGSVKAVLTTEKGVFTIDLLPEDAPLTVDNFIKLARSRYFNGVDVHRVVPNFVMQDGDPRGDGNGGPGWSIRCEINMVPYERGAVGMALSGKDTGGSQWFVTHSPQPHLDGGYAVFGKVSENDMSVVDKIVRGDKIISVRIIGK